MCHLLGTKKIRTTPYRPQSDGMIERLDKTLESQFAKYVQDHQRDWDGHVPYVMMAYRSSVHESTGQRTAKLMFGRDLRLPVDLMFGRRKDRAREGTTYSDFVVELEETLNCAHDFARMHLKFSADRMKRRYDVGANTDVFREGDAVRCHNPQRRRGISPKLWSCWEGPYLVRRKFNDVVYEIQISPRAKTQIVHRDRLWKYNGENPDWFATFRKKLRKNHCGCKRLQLGTSMFIAAEQWTNGQRSRTSSRQF